jgi:UrcA family protein
MKIAIPILLAMCALTALNAAAAELDPITVSAPIVKNLARETATQIPIEDITVQARIAVDKETLRNDSGVVLLKDRVREAAYKACAAADPFMTDDGTCVREAEKSAQPQVDAVIASARNNTMQ